MAHSAPMTDGQPSFQPRVEAQPLERVMNAQRDAATALGKLLKSHAELGSPTSRFEERRKADDQDLRKADDRDLRKVLPPIEVKRYSRVYLIEGDRGSGKTALLVTLIDDWNHLAQGRPPRSSLNLPATPGHVLLPIGLIDLRELPKQTALKAYLASLLHRLYEHLDAGVRGPVPLPTSPDARPNRLADAWKRFLTATATSEADIRKRDIDPETFAEEIHAAERDRNDLQASFCELIDVFVERWRGPDTPLFIIAIDDADMNPDRMLECLELTQMFSHPRVAYLLTGDEDLFLVALENTFAAQLGRASRASEEGAKLAQRFYAKCIPLTQRQRLSRLAPDERVKFLFEELRRVEFPEIVPPTGSASPTIADLMTLFPTIANALPSTIRELTDFQQWLRDELQLRSDRQYTPQPHPLTVTAFELLWGISRLQRETASTEDRQVLDRMISQTWTVEGVNRIRIHVDDVGFQVVTDYANKNTTFGRQPCTVETELRSITSIDPVVPNPILGSPPLRLDDGIRSTLLLAVVLSPPRPHIMSDRPIMSGASNIINVTLTAGKRSVRTTWPIPTINNVLDTMRFVRAWGQWFQQPSGGKPFEDGLFARAYAECYLRANQWSPEQTELACRPWSELLLNGNARMFDDLLLFAAPESGLPDSVRREILDAWEANSSADYWEDSCRRAREMRDRRVSVEDREFLRQVFGDEDPWFVAIEYADEDLGPLGELLRKPLVCKHHWADSLGDYLTDDLRWRLRTDIDSVERLAKALSENPSADERERLARLESGPKSQMRWDGTQLVLSGGVEIYASTWRTREDVEIRGQRYSVATATGMLRWAGEDRSLAEQVAFLLAHGLATDRQGLSSGKPPKWAWPLLRVEDLESGSELTPWLAPPWSAHVDLNACMVGWQQIQTQAFSIGEMARAFCDLQLCVFRRRAFAAEVVPSWAEIVEGIEEAIAEARGPRAWLFADWFASLTKFLDSGALLPSVDVAALAAELGRSVAGDNVAAVCKMLLIHTSDAAARRPFLGANQRVVLDVLVTTLAEQELQARSPVQFRRPAKRVTAATQLIEQLNGLELRNRLTPDLQEHIFNSTTASINAASNAIAMHASHGVKTAMVEAWRASVLARTSAWIRNMEEDSHSIRTSPRRLLSVWLEARAASLRGDP